ESLGPSGIAVGVDLSVGMLRAGRAGRPTVLVVAADAVDLPFREAAFDTVVSNFVIFHFPDYRTALFDMIRVLKTGGRLAVSAWAPGEDEFTRAWGELTDEAVGKELIDDAYRQVMPWRELFADRVRFEEVLRDAGLHPVRVEKREYRLVLSREDYLAGRATSVSGRFTRDMLGEDGWAGFLQRARAVFEERFPERINDFRDVNLAVGTRATDGLQQ